MTDTKPIVTRHCYTVHPTFGRHIDLASGWWHDQPAVAMFVGKSHEPIVLTRADVAELVSTMVEIVEEAV